MLLLFIPAVLSLSAPAAFINIWDYTVVPVVLQTASGSYSAGSGSGSRSQSWTVNFPTSMLGGTPRMLLAIYSLNINFANSVEYILTHSGASASSCTVTLDVTGSTVVPGITLLVAGTTHSLIEHAQFGITWNNQGNGNLGSSNMGNLPSQGPNSHDFTINFAIGKNGSNTIVCYAYDNGVYMDKDSGSSLSFTLTPTSVNGGNFKATYATFVRTKITRVQLSYLAYERQAVEGTGYRTFNGAINQASSTAASNTVVLNAMAMNSSTLVMGITGYSYQSSGMNVASSFSMFNGTHLTLTVTDGSPGRVLNIAYFFKISLECVAPDIYLSLDRTGCLSSCPIMQYANAFFRCQFCYYSCYTCLNNSNICVSCNLTRDHRVANAFNQCVCLTSWYDNPGAPVCLPCHYSCLTCSGNTVNECLSCNSSSPRSFVGSFCPCDPGFFDNTVTMSCNLCSYTCYTCSVLSTICTGCLQSNFREPLAQSGVCPCMPKYYDAGLPKCDPCHPTCLTCTGPLSDQCTSCDRSLGRFLTSTSCICGYNYFSDATNNCSLCHYSCLNCTSALASSCIACYPFSHRTLTASACPCDVLFYDNGVTLCASCHYSCITCSGPASASCLTCTDLWFRQVLGTTCPCLPGYYQNGNSLCAPCYYTCYTCSATATCNSCDPINAFRTFSTPNCNCITGHYEAGVTNCGTCHVSCLDCSGAGPNNCTACDTNLNRGLISTACPCNPGFFTSNGLCLLCHYTCTTCSAYGQYYCASCLATNQRLFYNGNSCVCVAGYFDQGLATCVPCYSRCGTCQLSAFRCLSCLLAQGRLWLSNNTCGCMAGYYQAYVDVCPACAPACATCVGIGTICMSCFSANFRNYNSITQMCDCLAGYYQTGAAACLTCDTSCLTCDGPLSNNCITCSPIRLLTSNQCICYGGHYAVGLNCALCHTTCATCTGSLQNQCVLCDNTVGRTVLTNAGGTFCICMPGYYLDLNSVCAPCLYYCGTCSPSDYRCTSCAPASNRYLSGTNCPCSVGYYDNFVALCPPCSYTCLSCIASPSNCLSCSYSRQLIGSNCPCSLGTFDTGVALCSLCSAPCLGCYTLSTTCVSCDSTLHYFLSSNTCRCVAGYYTIGITCYSCPAICLTCSSALVCTSCDNSANLFPQGSTCVCGGAFYLLASTCYPCHPNCRTCSGPTNLQCMTCFAGFNLIGSTCLNQLVCSTGLLAYKGVCVANCPAGNYPSANACPGCPVPCATCSAGACLTCVAALFLQAPTCVTSCSPAYYLNGTACLPCKAYCLDCYMQSLLFCTRCTAPMLVLADSCYSLCPTGYVAVLALCSACFEVCTACFGVSQLQCLSCITNYTLVQSKCQLCKIGTYFLNGKCSTCNRSCLSCSAEQCWTCTSGHYLSNSKCAPYLSFYNQQKQLYPCFPTCRECSGPEADQCRACVLFGGTMGAPLNGRCDCSADSVAVYSKGCQKDKGLMALRDTSINMFLSAVVFVGTLAAFFKDFGILEQTLLIAQQYQLLLPALPILSTGLDTVITHFSLYTLYPLGSIGSQPLKYFGTSRLLYTDFSQPFKGSVLAYLFLQLAIWAVVFALWFARRLTLWRHSVFNRKDWFDKAEEWLYLVFSEVPCRFNFIFGPPVLMALLQLKKENLGLAVAGGALLLGTSIVTLSSSVQSLLKEWIVRSLDPSRTNLKGGLLNHALYVLRLALAAVLALLPLGTALIAGLALVGASFLLLFYFNPFFKRTRQVQLLGQFCLMLVYGFTLGVQFIDSSSGKFGLTVVAEVAILMNGAGALVIAIWWILFGNKDAEQVVPREKHSQTERDLKKYWSQLMEPQNRNK